MAIYKYLGYGVTNSKGKAKLDHDKNGDPITHSYTGAGAGELDIIASLDNPSTISDSSIQSEIYSLYDVLFKDIGTSSDYTDWRTSSTVDIARNTEYTTVSPKDSTVFSSRAVDLVSGANCIEFDVNINVSTVFLSLRMNITAVTTLSNEYLGIATELDQWHHIRIEWNETQYRAIVDGNIKEYRTLSNTPNRFQFSINANTGLEIKYKNFIMY